MGKETPKIILTFKPSERWIYEEIRKHSGMGNWVKDILRDYLSKKTEKRSVYKSMKDPLRACL
jgi:hypothetical protein